MAWISYLRWVVLWMWCVLDVPGVPAFRFWPRPTVRPPRSGVSPLARTGQLIEPDSSPLALRRATPVVLWGVALSAGRFREPRADQVHRVREQAQDTLGTADHSTRPSRPGQSRVDMEAVHRASRFIGLNRGRWRTVPGRPQGLARRDLVGNVPEDAGCDEDLGHARPPRPPPRLGRAARVASVVPQPYGRWRTAHLPLPGA